MCVQGWQDVDDTRQTTKTSKEYQEVYRQLGKCERKNSPLKKKKARKTSSRILIQIFFYSFHFYNEAFQVAMQGCGFM